MQTGNGVKQEMEDIWRRMTVMTVKKAASCSNREEEGTFVFPIFFMIFILLENTSYWKPQDLQSSLVKGVSITPWLAAS
jgi:hypothetical protein